MIFVCETFGQIFKKKIKKKNTFYVGKNNKNMKWKFTVIFLTAVAQKIWVTRMKWSKYEEMWKLILSRLQVQNELRERTGGEEQKNTKSES